MRLIRYSGVKINYPPIIEGIGLELHGMGRGGAYTRSFLQYSIHLVRRTVEKVRRDSTDEGM
ncbi:hypothetical protein [Rhodohalobacter sp.]|uniref:hypothetical protein n=1 Tax=Rhodohalobacter sp. TaxID=1974210 RepID=UPI002ACF07D7|nr:hypothetical protein [Rhodohalobacter sp.]MDZ7756767.1 hypothetical protein [Rhodohalobacter sp.]